MRQHFITAVLPAALNSVVFFSNMFIGKTRAKTDIFEITKTIQIVIQF
jgi:hypothetical protein